MRRVSAALAVAVASVLALASACAGAGGAPGGGPGSGAPAGPTGAPSAGPPAPTTERAAIFIAVLRRYLTTSDHSFGDTHRFPVAYVLDHTEASVGDPMAGDPRGGGPGTMPMLEAITAAEQGQIRTGLADVGRVEFVRDRAAVMDPVDDCQQVRGGAVLIALGPPRPAPASAEIRPLQPRPAGPPPTGSGAGPAARIHVGIHGFVACLAATWFTYVVEPEGQPEGQPAGEPEGEPAGGRWRVVGTTGPMAIA